jgi:Fic family protein
LIDLPVLYLSRSIIQKKAQYYTLLREVGETGQWEQWVLFMLEAVRDTSVATLKLVSDIRTLMDQTIEMCRARLPKVTYSKELIEQLFIQPYIKIDHLTKAGIAQRRTASKYLKELEEIGVLKSFKAWKETVYINTRLYDMLKDEK